GVGLGLTLCKKIVDLHQGTMTFYSKKGKGTCVTIVFHFEKEFV
ncbi:MAG: ATP-binding protein, partial [Lachnospiraceae bacterium]|nr:ATP-binding protein [Lachnospiraceae bacterium]